MPPPLRFSTVSPSSQPLLISPPSPPAPSLSTNPFIRHPTPPPFISVFFSIPTSFFSTPNTHSTLLLPLALLLLLFRLPSPVLSLEWSIQQQNKAAYSITRWLIKQNQNSAALRSTRQHYDTALQREGDGFSLMRMTKGGGGGGSSDTDAEQ